MANWKYTLKSGKALRDALDNDDLKLTLDCIEECWNELKSNGYADDYDVSDFLEEKELILSDLIDAEEYGWDYLETEYDTTYDDVEENINYLLNDLYDFCDSNRIWIDV